MLDPMDLRILAALEENARMPHSQLAKKVGLSRAGLKDRLRRLEESGAILGYRAVLDRAQMGFPVHAFLRVKAAAHAYQRVIALARDIRQVRECHHAAGEDSFVLRVTAASDDDLKAVTARFQEIGRTKVWMIVSTPVEKDTT